MSKRSFGMAPGGRMSLDRECARRKEIKRKPKQSVVKKEPLSRQEEAWLRGDYALGDTMMSIYIRGGTEDYV